MTKARDARELPTAEEVRQLLDYNPETGVLVWKPRVGNDRDTKAWNGRYAGKPAGSQKSDGYWQLAIFGQRYVAHRVIWLVVTGEWPSLEIDHRDCNRSNNRWSNLRQANDSENRQNSRKAKNNTSGFKGVCLYKRTGRYQAEIVSIGRRIHLGTFDTAEEAACAYLAAAKLHFGEFARAALIDRGNDGHRRVPQRTGLPSHAGVGEGQ